MFHVEQLKLTVKQRFTGNNMDGERNRHCTNFSAYGEKDYISKYFKQGNFAKLFD